MPTSPVTRDTRLRKPVSVPYRTGLKHAETEIGKWRAETGAVSHQSRPEIPEFADQRPGCASLTGGNVDGSHALGNRIVETALTGWRERIRTSEWRNQNPQSRRDMSRHKMTEAPKCMVFIDLAATRPDTARLREAMKAIPRFSGLIVFGAGIGAERRQLLLRHWLETPQSGVYLC